MKRSTFRGKKGQGLSLNVIIVAALALIVLVVLIMVFTGRIGVFQDQINEKSDNTLVEMQIQYGECHPSAVSEVAFKAKMTQADTDEDEAIAKAEFQDLITSCKGGATEDECVDIDGCKWSG